MITGSPGGPEVPAPSAELTRVVIVEDHEMVARSLVLVLGAEGWATEVVIPVAASPSATLAATLARVRSATPPPIVLIDLDLGAGVDGAELIEPVRCAGARPVILSGSSDRVRLAGCLERGALALVNKAEPLAQLVATIRRVAAGRAGLMAAERDAFLADLRAHRAEHRARVEPFRQLTRREQDVLRELSQGQSAEEIAEAGWVSVGTVRSQIHSILGKLGVHSQQAAMALAWNVGWALRRDGAPVVPWPPRSGARQPAPAPDSPIL